MEFKRRYKKGGQNKKNLIGQRFGKLLVLEESSERLEYAKTRTNWKCICDCGNYHYVTTNALNNGRTNSCGCIVKSGLNKKGLGELTGTYLGIAKRGAIQRNLEWSISKDDVWNKFLEQGRKCALSDVELILMKGGGGTKIYWTASLDRIDSAKGYSKENIQWIHKDLNRMKMDMSEEEFFQWCEKVHNKQVTNNFYNQDYSI